MSKQKNHPRIISVTDVKFGGDSKRKNNRYGWNVKYNGRVLGDKVVTYTRTTNIRTGALLKNPVVDTYTQHDAPMSGVISRVIRRRSTLRKLGVAI